MTVNLDKESDKMQKESDEESQENPEASFTHRYRCRLVD